MTLWGHQVHFVHVCHMYVWCACTGAWKLAPQGPIPFTMLFFLIKHYKPIKYLH